MAQSVTIGRVTADFELKTSAGGNPYVRFTIAENIGSGKSPRTQFVQVWAWGDDAKHLVKGKIRKGSLIWVSGRMELEEFTRRDGTADKRLKVILDGWGYIPTGKPKDVGFGNDYPMPDSAETDTQREIFPDGEIDGDRESLPE
jgi:single-stranded DNA-binding protein